MKSARLNAIAPGAVYTPLQRNTPQDVMVTGHILYVDGGAHFDRW
jgi:hypothetical protein